MQRFENPYGAYDLQRLPEQRNQPLRAWDAADEYLLNHLHEAKRLRHDSKVLVVNDAFGALAVSLGSVVETPVQHWSDSFLAHQASLLNAQANGVAPPVLLPATEEPDGVFDLVLIKVPKTLGLLEDQLVRLASHVRPETIVIAAGMVKHLPKSALLLFEKILGATTTSLAKKKARLIFASVEKAGVSLASPYPVCMDEPTTGLRLCHHANVFSKDKLDIGTRFLLQQFPALPQARVIVDLGCGNGVLGLVAQRQQAAARLVFLDESYMAVESARMNYAAAFPEGEAVFMASDGLSEYRAEQHGAPDLILCNPPFHQQHSTGDFIAWQMFVQSHRALQKGGELWVVGNRHLHYHSKLKKLFGNCQLVASNKKFVVLRVRKQSLERNL